VINPI
jgi:Co/Zn/Cd efflux system component